MTIAPLALALLLTAVSASAADKKLLFYEFEFDYTGIRADQQPPLAAKMTELAKFCGAGCAALDVQSLDAFKLDGVPGSERLIKIAGRYALEAPHNVFAIRDVGQVKGHKIASVVRPAGEAVVTLGLAAGHEAPCRVLTPLSGVEGPAFKKGGFRQHGESRAALLAPAAHAFVPPQSANERAWVCVDGKPLVPVRTR